MSSCIHKALKTMPAQEVLSKMLLLSERVLWIVTKCKRIQQYARSLKPPGRTMLLPHFTDPGSEARGGMSGQGWAGKVTSFSGAEAPRSLFIPV